MNDKRRTANSTPADERPDSQKQDEASLLAEANQRASGIKKSRQRWALHGYIPMGCLSIVTGRGGAGKSSLGAAIAAHVTRGSKFRERTKDEVTGNVAWFSAEESLSLTTKPKLQAAGARLTRVIFPGVDENGVIRVPYNLSTDMPTIEKMVDGLGIKMLLFDPFLCYVGATDINHAQSVRQLLFSVCRIAEKTKAAFVAIVHPTKSRTGSVVDRIGGSAALPQAARSVVYLHQPSEEPDSRYLFHLKCNCAPLSPTLHLALGVHPVLKVPRIDYIGESAKNVDDLDAMPNDGVEGDVMRDAMVLLRKILAADYVPAKEVMSEAKAAGIGERTLRAAKVSLGVLSRRVSDGLNSGFWEWGLANYAPLRIETERESGESDS